MNTNETLVVYANRFDGAILKITATSDKAIQVTNTENNRKCWLPKSGLKLYKPGVATYENEYLLADWFRSRINYTQERALNLAE